MAALGLDSSSVFRFKKNEKYFGTKIPNLDSNLRYLTHMKILVINRPWFIPALKKLGHKTLFLTQSLDKLSKRINLEKNFDLILVFGCSTKNRWWEWIEGKKPGIFNNLKIKKVYWEMEAGKKSW